MVFCIPFNQQRKWCFKTWYLPNSIWGVWLLVKILCVVKPAFQAWPHALKRLSWQSSHERGPAKFGAKPVHYSLWNGVPVKEAGSLASWALCIGTPPGTFPSRSLFDSLHRWLQLPLPMPTSVCVRRGVEVRRDLEDTLSGSDSAYRNFSHLALFSHPLPNGQIRKLTEPLLRRLQ